MSLGVSEVENNGHLVILEAAVPGEFGSVWGRVKMERVGAYDFF